MELLARASDLGTEMRSIILALMLPALALVSLCATADANEKAAGQAGFEQYCAACHGMSAKGDGPVAESLLAQPADSTKLGARYGAPLPKPKLVDLIDGTHLTHAHGVREMPVWGKQLHVGVTCASSPPHRAHPRRLPPG